ncbi:unnamed protein product, partial [marine sediment metagenome]
MTMNDSRPPKPKLRWFQFSLRMLLLFVLVAGAGFGLYGRKLLQDRNLRRLAEEQARKREEARRQNERVVKQLEAVGMSAQYSVVIHPDSGDIHPAF